MRGEKRCINVRVVRTAMLLGLKVSVALTLIFIYGLQSGRAQQRLMVNTRGIYR